MAAKPSRLRVLVSIPSTKIKYTKSETFNRDVFMRDGEKHTVVDVT